ncbi:hypothetical protein EJ05DRAFT_514841 [Pseudovirgaria hyperparasitica]|uniref:Uncharacterized protein n=1 Tax=Pseudovirgaria hyperparasitica TaxID=470096 RepID=A0A6A6VVT3_9PEZI|nr:uncharacterized protein EJ05DRAFT_514841 [Pseudovirgaria hyperparasitica]KAF2753351.1 hypothetical protein EJ05DRAFT_514841 [Pseudovirgaria hyperparasitica]
MRDPWPRLFAIIPEPCGGAHPTALIMTESEASCQSNRSVGWMSRTKTVIATNKNSDDQVGPSLLGFGCQLAAEIRVTITIIPWGAQGILGQPVQEGKALDQVQEKASDTFVYGWNCEQIELPCTAMWLADGRVSFLDDLGEEDAGSSKGDRNRM